MKTLFRYLLFLLFLTPVNSFASDLSSSEISGKIFDENSLEVLPFATVEVKQNGEFVTGSTADIDGLYTIKPIDAGTYELTFRYVGYKPITYQGVLVSTGQITFLDVPLQTNMGKPIVIPGKRVYPQRLVEIDKISSGQIFIAKDMKKMPTRNPNDVLDLSAGTYQSDIGEPIQVRGSRPGSTLYLLDGMKVSNFSGIPSGAINQLQVITGGIPAKYGDTTGGVIILNTW